MADIQESLSAEEPSRKDLRERMNNLLILSGIASTPTPDDCLKKSIPELHLLLKNKNIKLKHHSDIYERSSNLLYNLGIKVPTLADIVKGLPLQSLGVQIQKETERNRGEDVHQGYFRVEQLEVDNLTQFIHKCAQFSVLDNIHTIMEQDSHQLEIEEEVPALRNHYKLEQFNQVISSFVTHGINQESVSAIELLRQFSQISKNQLWGVLISVFQGVNVEEPTLEIQSQLVFNCTLLLEQQMSKKIPFNDRAFQSYVKDQGLWMFVDATTNYIYYDRQGKPLWVMVYMLMRTGRMQDIQQVTREEESPNFYNDFMSYMNGVSRFYSMEPQNKDIFLEAIYSIFNKKAVCSPSLIQGDKDFIWFNYKAEGTEDYVNPSAFLAIQNKIINSYISTRSEENYTNLVYVLAFNQLIQPNRFLDIEDSIHLSIFIHLLFNREECVLWTRENRQEFFRNVMDYAQELSVSNLQLAIDYLIICYDYQFNSAAEILARVSNLLIFSKSVETFFTQSPTIYTPLQQRIRMALEPTPQQYQTFVCETIDKYASVSRNYIYPSKVYESIINDTSKSIEYLLAVIGKDILKKSALSEGEVGQISDIVDRLQRQQDRLSDTHSRVLDFLLLTKHVKDTIVFNQPVNQSIFKTKYSPLKQEVASAAFNRLLMDLNRAEYYGIFGVFLYYFLKAMLKYYSSKPQKIQEFQHSIRVYRKYIGNLTDILPSKARDREFEQILTDINHQLETQLQLV